MPHKLVSHQSKPPTPNTVSYAGYGISCCHDLPTKGSFSYSFVIRHSLFSELLPNLPSDGIFSFDSLLNKGHKPEQGNWQWKDDQSVWHPYSWIDSRIIEAAHQGGEEELSLNTLGRSYIVDFNSMQQVSSEFRLFSFTHFELGLEYFV